MNERHPDTAAGEFVIEGTFVKVQRYGSGHIHDTYCAVFAHHGMQTRVILQRINTGIFKDPVEVMTNVQRVTEHLAARLSQRADLHRRVLVIIPTRGGQPFHVDADGQYWRAYRFIEQAHTFDSVQSVQQAYEVAKAFGTFQRLLIDLPGSRLKETIPGFHDTPKRFLAFESAASANVAKRAAGAAPEIAFALKRRPLAGCLHEADLPERIIHNDTKINNVLLDNKTGEGLCVIDLDTVMPGLALYDFGDMVRTATCPAPEDEGDLSKVSMHFALFEAVARGYLSAASGMLTASERACLVTSAKVMVFEQGLRFLTDYLAGDVYYKVHREDHNLDRCRTQFKLLESIEAQEGRMHLLIASI